MHRHPCRHLMSVALVGCSVVIAVFAYLVIWVEASSTGRVSGYVPTLPDPAATAPTARLPAQAATAVDSAGLQQASLSWASQVSRRVGIPAVALRAYASAELNAPTGCHLGWTTLAGIGWIESGHGTHGGSTLLANGDTTRAISGPQLAGGLGTALGPMQFIVSTWDRWATDGDGDGTADVNNINDAAYAAARYLCADGRDLSRASDWAAAVYSYNHAQWYVDEVYNAANTYAARAG